MGYDLGVDVGADVDVVVGCWMSRGGYLSIQF
jgi:hypothetical protein